MTIETFDFRATAEIGTMSEFKGFHLVESMMTGELDDGRKVEVVRSALGHPFFEVKIEGEDQHMRINLKPALIAAAEHLGNITAPTETSEQK